MIDEMAALQAEYDDLIVKRHPTVEEMARISGIEAQIARQFGADWAAQFLSNHQP